MKTRLAGAIAALLLLTSCGVLSAGKLVLPAAEDLESVTITVDQLDLTVTGGDSIARLLDLLRRSVKENTGRPSVQDIPAERAGLARIDFGFRAGGAGTVFLYREGTRLFLEQPYQGIYEMDSELRLDQLQILEQEG